jgi:pyruvate/2-oxoglutarate dehydrogenase complex dihydrolipoamide dehydrogenase (E3) component
MEYTVGSKSVGNLKAKVTKADYNMVPQVIFTDPQVAFVGLTEQSTKGLGLNTHSVDSEIGSVDGAKLHTDGYVGHARLIIDEDKKIVVGATFIGPQV